MTRWFELSKSGVKELSLSTLTGQTIEYLLRQKPELMGRIKDLVDDNVLEILASGCSHPILPLLPPPTHSCMMTLATGLCRLGHEVRPDADLSLNSSLVVDEDLDEGPHDRKPSYVATHFPLGSVPRTRSRNVDELRILRA